MQTIIKRLLIFLFISTIPMTLTTALWLFTIGYFSWVDTIHSEPYAVITAFFVFFAFLVATITPDYELQN